MKTNTKSTTTTTTNQALTMEELKAIRREQTKQTFIDFIKANRNKDSYFNNLYSSILYQEAEKAVYIALRARYSKSGLQFLADLQHAQSTDNQARNNDIIAESITHHESKHNSFLKGYEFFNNQAQRLMLTEEERATAFTLAQEFNNKAQAEQQHINALYDSLNITLSDRADLTQTAIIKLIEVEQTPVEISKNILASYGATTIEELTEEERATAQSTSNFRAVINTVGRAIAKLTSPDALNSTVTKSRKATAQEFINWCNRYGIHREAYETAKDFNEALKSHKAPKTTKRCRASDCFETMEYKQTKTMQGYYIITHYVTVAPYQYIEDFSTTEDGENDIQYIKTYNPIVDKFHDFERIDKLTELAELTESERLVLSYYCNAIRYYTTKEDIIKYICTATKLSKATVYRRVDRITKALEPIAKQLHIIK